MLEPCEEGCLDVGDLPYHEAIGVDFKQRQTRTNLFLVSAIQRDDHQESGCFPIKSLPAHGYKVFRFENVETSLQIAGFYRG